MKKKSTLILNFLLLAFLLPSIHFSQDRPVVMVPDNIDGDYFGVLNKFIMSDTTETGERAHPNAIYRLERGKFYDVNQTLQLNFNITIDAVPDDPNNSTRPPMILYGKDAQGALVGPLMEVYGDENYFELKGVIVQAVQYYDEADGPDFYNRGRWGIFVYGAFHRMVIDNCIFAGMEAPVFQGRFTDRCSWIFTNNIIYNGHGNQSVAGSSFYYNAVKTTYSDSIIVRNNTFFNNGEVQFGSFEFADYIEFTHNTMYNISINGIWAPLLTNAKFSDNLFVDYQTVGETEWELINGHWDKGSPRHGRSSILKMNIHDPQILADHRMTEADRKVEANNNVYWWHQEIKDYWENNISQKDIDMGYTGEIWPITWINSITDSMFQSLGDYNYPNYVQENNEELNPGFDPTMVSAVAEKELEWVKEYRKLGWTTLPDAPENRFYSPDGKLFDLTWPLTFNLTYTNEAVLTHAEGGFPAGDLNWFPDKKAEWEEWIETDVKRDNSATVPSEYQLSQNYPNPFNPTTEISFAIPVSGNTTLGVYNVLGQKVATLVNEHLSAGSYNYQFDASKLTSGIYFYKLQSNNFSQIRKMMLLK